MRNFCETCTTALKHAHIEYLKALGGGGETRYANIYKMSQNGWLSPEAPSSCVDILYPMNYHHEMLWLGAIISHSISNYLPFS